MLAARHRPYILISYTVFERSHVSGEERLLLRVSVYCLRDKSVETGPYPLAKRLVTCTGVGGAGFEPDIEKRRGAAANVG